LGRTTKEMSFTATVSPYVFFMLRVSKTGIISAGMV